MLEKKDLILIILLIILIGVVLFSIYYVKIEGMECLNNPVVYGLKDINTSCYCTGGIILNKSGVYRQIGIK